MASNNKKKRTNNQKKALNEEKNGVIKGKKI